MLQYEIEKPLVKEECLIQKNKLDCFKNEIIKKYSDKIVDVDLFKSSLEELKLMVGNDDIKLDICKQIKYLMSEKIKGGKNTHMLNTVIYGPPGTGKTMIGNIMAKIWYSLGFLDGYVNPIEEYIHLDDPVEMQTYAFVLTILVKVIAAGFAGFVACLSNFKTSTKIILIGGVFLILGYICYKIYDYFQNPPKQHYSSILKVVSREDFVDRYVGGTDKKTIALLKRNLGKVLFIDEAYSLINSPQDSFGAEALTALNRFLSENPGKICVIMAGYKELLQNGVFKIQPGLPRRFMWHFESPGYSSEELFKIMVRKLNNENWILDARDFIDIEKLFDKKKSVFKSFGGDVEKLIFFSKLNHCDSGKSDKRVLDFFNISEGIKCLEKNNVY